MNIVISTNLTLLVITLLLGEIQLSIFGILGQYLGKLYLEVKQRPLYIVKEENIVVNKEFKMHEEVEIKS